MRRDLYKYFPQYLDLISEPVPQPFPEPEPDPEIVDPLKEVLDEIFAVDPVTGNPKGDIQYFLSKDGNPQVKAWLESHLLQPRVVSSGSDPAKVSDDLIAEFSRQSGESVEDYAARLEKIRDDATTEYNKLVLENQKTE